MEEINKQDAELLEYLRGLGFEGEQLTTDIRRYIKMGLPAFNTHHSIDFGADQVSYQLHFVKEAQFKAYRLNKYTATFRGAIPVIDTHVTGIDSAALDGLMAKVHWGLFFKQGNVAGSGNTEMANEAIGSLDTLMASGNPDAQFIGNLLMGKYWPKDVLTSDQLDLLGNTNAPSRDFQSGCNAITAYQVLSGRLDDIYEKIRVSGLDYLPGFELYRSLEDLLKTNPPSFLLKTEYNDAEGHTAIHLPVTDNNGNYHIENYTAATALYPEIEHALYHGVDTRLLEKEMKGIDWSNDHNLFLFYGDREPDLQPLIIQIARQMKTLSSHEESLAAYDLLSLKYWQKVSFFEDFIREEAWHKLDNLPRNMMEFPVDLDYRAAINLLSGRAIMEHLLIPTDEETSNWVRLRLDKLNDNDAYHYKHILGASREEMGIMLHQLPLLPQGTALYLPFLMRGDLVPATLSNKKGIILGANPEQQTIDVFTLEGRPIPVNIHFDPDWKPPSKSQVKTLATETKQGPLPPEKKDNTKGRKNHL